MSAEEILLQNEDVATEHNQFVSINRSAAAGYAYRHEAAESDWNAVYLLADERMYMNKTEMKKIK